MSDLPERPELRLEELSAHNIDLVRERLLSARSFEELVEVESYLDTLWSVADTELRDSLRRSTSQLSTSQPGAGQPSTSQPGAGRHRGADLRQVHRLLQLAHDSAAVDQFDVAANALTDAAECLTANRTGGGTDDSAG
jgi:hypothetical protein